MSYLLICEMGLYEHSESQARIKGFSQEPAVTTQPLSSVFRVHIRREQGHDSATPRASVHLPQFSWAATVSFLSGEIGLTTKMMFTFSAPLKSARKGSFPVCFQLVQMCT